MINRKFFNPYRKTSTVTNIVVLKESNKSTQLWNPQFLKTFPLFFFFKNIYTFVIVIYSAEILVSFTF